MGSIRQFDHQFTVNASLERVIASHNDPLILRILTPPPGFVTFNEPGLNTESSMVDFNLRLGPISIHWVAEISVDDSSPGFLDRQIVGPFEYWEHRHTFRKIDSNSTQIIDQIKARPGKSLISGLISRFMWLSLPLLFTYRAWRTRRELQAKFYS
jgi:ligand-binding SRPBCC domain-containing protein